MSGDLWLVMNVQSWKHFELSQPLPFKVDIDPGSCIGYLPVYASREQAEADYPDATVVAINLVGDLPSHAHDECDDDCQAHRIQRLVDAMPEDA